MTDDEERAIINRSIADMVVRLEGGNKRPESVVVLVLYKEDEEHHIAHMVHPEADPRFTEGVSLCAAAELIVTHIHDRGLCEACGPELDDGGTVH